jgi:peptidoglycan/xylan/chitin deacetylase (PgdA/CDA1 family)
MRTDSGALVVSLDLELLWGYHDVGITETLRAQADGTRPAIRRLLDLFERYDVPATWAIVGHLFLDEAERSSDGRAHPSHPRPQYPWVRGDWFDALPRGDATTCPQWYGPDVVDLIKRALPRQEIGCHTFSHVVMGDPACSPEVARAELERCRALAAEAGVDLRTIVFPRNKVGHLDVVRESGFEVYRGRDVHPFPRVPARFEDSAQVVARLLSKPPAPVLPKRTREGLINLPGSIFYMAATDWQRYVPMPVRTVIVKRGVREAARQHAIFHLRLHPEALVFEADRLFAGLEDIFDEAARLRHAGTLRFLSMRDAAFEYVC